MPNFNDAAVMTVFDKLVSYALTTGRFDNVNQHEPKNSPGHGIQCSIWVNNIIPIRSSGLGATSGIVTLYARAYMNFRQQPFDMIDPPYFRPLRDALSKSGLLLRPARMSARPTMRCVSP